MDTYTKDIIEALQEGYSLSVSASANEQAVQRVLNMPVGDDTRSEFKWIRLVNGDLILGVYPTGDGYFDVEADVEADMTGNG